MPIYTAQHPAVCGHGWGAIVLWLRGFPDAGRRHANQAVSLAHELGDSPSITWALGVRAQVHQLMREVQPALELADAAMAKAEETAFAYVLSYARIVKGWALAEAAKGDEGADQIREAIAALSASRAGLLLTFGLGTLAEAYGRTGRIEEGIEYSGRSFGPRAAKW
jgi:adenylate cyclase